MAFTYGTANSGFQSHKLRTALIIITVAVSFYAAGMLSKSAYAAYNTRQLDKTCRSYISQVLEGDLDKAYEQSGQAIKDNQSLEDYKQTLGRLKTDTPEFNSDLQDVNVLDSKSGSCAINVDGLPASEGERSDGLFNMGVVKEGRSWKVGSLSVE